MHNLIINRIGFEFTERVQQLFISTDNTQLFRVRLNTLERKLLFNPSLVQQISALKSAEIFDAKNPYVYYSFIDPKSENVKLQLSPIEFQEFKGSFVKHLLITFLSKKGFLIEPYRTGINFSAYQYVSEYNSEWKRFRRFDFIVKERRNELIVSLGSDFVLLSNGPITLGDVPCKILDEAQQYIRSTRDLAGIERARVIANREIRKILNVPRRPRPLSYKEVYEVLNSKIYNSLKELNNESLRIHTNGFKTVPISDIGKVAFDENRMIFGSNYTDINAATGMRDGGPYKIPENASDFQFLFIYQNKDDANNLYLSFKNGYKHFPGLLSYVGIPATVHEKRLNYSSIDNLKNQFDQFIERDFPNSNYSTIIAIVIGPFDKDTSTELEHRLYYYLKLRLLQKNVPSQFVDEKSIRSPSFQYFLPNIAIAILAKAGGVPWRLKSKPYQELVIGFNQTELKNKRFIGSAVFFNNEGTLGQVATFPEADNSKAIIHNLRAAIDSFLSVNKLIPSRLVIHYYKQPKKEDQQSIENLIKSEFRFSLPFTIVEINDSKTQSEICFDTSYESWMPESGTYVRVGENDYLLFNNTRYQQYPLKKVDEEWPIKIKIFFADTIGFSHREIIAQAYEFSRLYWKGLKQRSQPVTIEYSKLIADFAAHFAEAGKHDLPDNDTTQRIPWFL